MSASEKVHKNKKVAFEDGNINSKREPRSRSRGKARDRRAKSQDVRSTVNKDGEPRKRDRSLITLVRQGSRKSVSNLVRLFEAGKSYYVSTLTVFSSFFGSSEYVSYCGHSVSNVVHRVVHCKWQLHHRWVNFNYTVQLVPF